LYWYLVMPLHHFALQDLARTIVGNSIKCE
jgi:hypothetical protein